MTNERARCSNGSTRPVHGQPNKQMHVQPRVQKTLQTARAWGRIRAVRGCSTCYDGTNPIAMTAHPLRLAATKGSDVRWQWMAAAAQMAATATGAWPLDVGDVDWTCFPRIATRTPGVSLQSVGAARDFAVSTLQRWEVTDRCDDIAVVVSELLTNALRHALPAPGKPAPLSGPARPAAARALRAVRGRRPQPECPGAHGA